MNDDFEDDICRNNHGGNPLSEEANTRTKKERDTRRIYAHVHALGWYGATAQEASVALGMPLQTCSARFSEMRRDGHLVLLGVTRLTPQNCRAAVNVTRGMWVTRGRKPVQLPLFAEAVP